MSIIRTTAITLASILVTLCVALFLVLTTPAGLTFLERSINAVQSSAVISGLRGSLLGRFSVDEITVADSNGTWLTISDANVRWTPEDLFRGTLRIPRVRARSLDLSRLPEGTEGAGTKSDTGELPSFLPGLILDELRIEKILLGAVTEPSIPELTLSGSAAVTSPTGPGRIELHLHPRDQKHPELELLARLNNSTLACSGTFTDPTGDMVAFLAGLPTPQPLDVSFQGSGTQGDYQGDISLQARKMLSSRLHMEWSGAGNAGTARGEVRLDPAGPFARAASWTGEVLDLDLQTGTDEQGRQVRNSLEISSRLLNLSARSEIDLKEMRTDTSFSLAHLNPAGLAGQTGILFKKPTPLTGTITGSLSAPTMRCSLRAESLQAGTLWVEQPEVTLTAAPAQTGELPQYSATLLTTAGNVTLPAILNSGPLQLQAVLEGLGTQVMQARLHSSAQGVDLKGTASLAPGTGTLSAELAGTLRPERFLVPGVGPAPETLDLSGSLKGSVAATDLTAELEIGLGGFPEDPALLGALLGPKSTLTLSGNLNRTRLLLEALSLEGAGITAAGNGSFTLASGAHRAELTGEVLAAALSPDLAHIKTVELDARATGTGEKTALSARLAPGSERVFGLPISLVKLNSELNDFTTAPAGQWRMELETGPGPLIATGNLNLANGLSVTGGKLEGLNLDGTFSVDFPAKRPRREVRFQMESTALSSVGVLVDQPLQGRLNIRGSYVETETSAELALSGSGRNLGYDDTLSVAALELPALTLNPAEAGRPDLELALRGVVVEDVVLDRARLHTAAEEQGLRFSLRGEGTKPAPLHLSLSGLTRQTGSDQTVGLEVLRGEYNGFPVRLLAPADLRLRNGRPELGPVSLALGDGTLEIRGVLNESDVEGDAVLRGLSLTSLQLLAPFPLPDGQLNATASLNGSPERPDLRAEIRIKDLAPAGAEQDNDVIGSLDISARTTSNGLQARGDLAGLGPDPLRLSGNIPLVFSLQPFQLQLPADSRMRVSAQGDVDLARISDLLPLSDLYLGGSLHLDAGAAGTVTAPNLTGTISVQNGRAEYVRTGTVLENIGAEALLRGDRVLLKRFSATDGDTGTLSANGTVTLPLRSAPAYALTADMRDARLMASDLATAHVQGTCRVRGDALGTTVRADLTIPRAEVNISRNPDPNLVPVPVREINIRNEDRVEQPAKPTPPADLALDVAVSIPGRMYVRGRGLDSEWKGNLKVTGTAERPEIRGRLESVRGVLAFAGRDLRLSKGEVTLGGGTPPDPLLNIVTAATIDSTEAQLKIQGSARKPELIMTSVPPLPQDEVLALLLFGESVANLTPMQALQLANTARTLAGTSGRGGFDPLGFTRSLLGLDDIKVGSAEEGGMQVGLGKYLTDDVYVEVEKGLTTDRDTLSVEMEVTPHVEVETEVGTDSSGKVGVNWRWDY